jgi:hypothetical protein
MLILVFSLNGVVINEETVANGHISLLKRLARSEANSAHVKHIKMN